MKPKSETPLIALEENKNRCKNCNNIYILEYPTCKFYPKGRRFFYCKIKGSNRTFNGMKKIKANDPACRKYEGKK